MLLVGDQISRTMFSAFHLLRAILSHTIWVAQPLKTEKAEELPYLSLRMRDPGGFSHMDAKPCAPGWWSWAGSEGSGPGWESLESLGNHHAVRADASSGISGLTR